MATKETVYDEQIAPLMTKIIETRKEHRIPLVAQFDISCPEDEDLRCTTVLLEKGDPKAMHAAASILIDGFAALTVTTRSA